MICGGPFPAGLFKSLRGWGAALKRALSATQQDLLALTQAMHERVPDLDTILTLSARPGHRPTLVHGKRGSRKGRQQAADIEGFPSIQTGRSKQGPPRSYG